jgi:uncharacterized protein (TIGR00266 family)
VDYRIDGVVAQVLHLTLGAGETCWTSKGSLVALDSGIGWRLRVPGGVSGAVRRGVAGESLTLNFVESRAPNQELVLGANQPGKIEVWDLESDGPVLATRGAFLAAAGDVEITFALARRAGAAFFGGAGLFLQKVRGRGKVFLHGAGDFLDRRLAAGETLQVSTGNLAAFGEGVDYRIRGVGGCRKVLFGGEGLFMTEVQGPGRVLLQTLKRRHGQTRRGRAEA